MEVVALAELVELVPFVPAVKEHVFRLYTAGNHAFTDALRTAAGNDGYRESVHHGHADGKAVFGVVGAQEVPVAVTKHAAIRGNAVYVKGEGLDSE